MMQTTTEPNQEPEPVMIIIWVDGYQTAIPADKIYIPFFAREKN